MFSAMHRCTSAAAALARRNIALWRDVKRQDLHAGNALPVPPRLVVRGRHGHFKRRSDHRSCRAQSMTSPTLCRSKSPVCLHIYRLRCDL